MVIVHPAKKPLYGKIAQPKGGLAMVAIDQRESLRTMFSAFQKSPVPDKTLEEFKIAVAEILSPHVSAMLFDQDYGLKALDAAARAAPNCGVIVSVDKLIQAPGEAVTDTDIDYEVDPKDVRQRGGVALKFLLLWKGHQNRERCVQLAKEFMDRCNSAGLLGIVEAIVRNPDNVAPSQWNREAALIEAARELSAVNPDLYKTEVPFLGDGEPMAIIENSEAITEALSCPWVVLSSGVEPDKFPMAVELACRGGASGFLAGRGIWKDTIRAEASEYQSRLRSISVPRLNNLSSVIDAHARPWQEIVQFGE